MKLVMIDALVSNDYSFWLCRGLNKAGVDVTLICPENRKKMQEDFTVLPVSPKKGGGGSLRKILKYSYFLVWLFAYLWRSKADRIHFQFFRRERLECLYFPLLRLLNKPLYFTAHNVLPHENSWIDYYLRYLVYLSASRIIVHSENTKKKMLRMYRIPSDKICVLPAVRPVSGQPDSSINREMAREWLHLRPDNKVLLFFGFIREYKGIKRLLEAFEIASKTDKRLRLIIAGKAQNAELLSQYQAQINEMQSKENIIFRPAFIPKNEVDYYFRAADALALPYSRIDFSGVAQEAFAYSLPVLATDVGNFSELIEQGVNGYISANLSSEAFAEIIRQAFADMTALCAMGKAALTFDQSYPDWQEIGERAAAVYQQA